MAPAWSKEDTTKYGTPQRNVFNQRASPPTSAGVDAHNTVRSFVAKPPAWNPSSDQNSNKYHQVMIDQLHRLEAPLAPKPDWAARQHGTITIAQNECSRPMTCFIWVRNVTPFRRANLHRNKHVHQLVDEKGGLIYSIHTAGHVQLLIYVPDMEASDRLVTTLRQALNDRYDPIDLDVEVYPVTADQAVRVLAHETLQARPPPTAVRADIIRQTFRYSFDGQVLLHGCMGPNLDRSVGAASARLINAVKDAIRQQLAFFGVEARNIHLLDNVLARSNRRVVPYVVELRFHQDADVFIQRFAAESQGGYGGRRVQMPGFPHDINLWTTHMVAQAIVPVTPQNPLPPAAHIWTDADFFRWRQFGNGERSTVPTHPLLARPEPALLSGPPSMAVDNRTTYDSHNAASSSQQTTPTQASTSGTRQATNDRSFSSDDMLPHQTVHNLTHASYTSNMPSATHARLPPTPHIPPFDLNDAMEAFSLNDQNGQADGYAGGHAPGNNIIRRFLMDGSEVMFRALPGEMNVDTFIRFLNHFAFGQYRFVYVRKDFSTGKNVGYAFVDFTSPKSVITFLDYTLGELWPGSARKRVEMSFATVQGVEALIERFRNSVVMTEPEEHRPRLFHAFPDPLAGMQMPFPACDNQQKLWRSIHSAQDVGLFPNGKRQNHSRRGHFDPGNPRGEMARSYERVCQENRMMRGMLARGRGGRNGMYA